MPATQCLTVEELKRHNESRYNCEQLFYFNTSTDTVESDRLTKRHTPIRTDTHTAGMVTCERDTQLRGKMLS